MSASEIVKQKFLKDLHELLAKYDAEIVTEDHWTGPGDYGQDVRMTVQFKDWNIEEIDLGQYIDPEKHGGVDLSQLSEK